jgi:hypothetical protein
MQATTVIYPKTLHYAQQDAANVPLCRIMPRNQNRPKRAIMPINYASLQHVAQQPASLPAPPGCSCPLLSCRAAAEGQQTAKRNKAHAADQQAVCCNLTAPDVSYSRAIYRIYLVTRVRGYSRKKSSYQCGTRRIVVLHSNTALLFCDGQNVACKRCRPLASFLRPGFSWRPNGVDRASYGDGARPLRIVACISGRPR